VPRVAIRPLIALGIAAALASGCTLDRSAIRRSTPPDAALGDAAAGDGAIRDGAVPDAGDAAPVDAAVDAPELPDGGPACTERCSGNVAITCPGEVPEDCGTASRCVAEDDRVRCEPLLCVPGARVCTAGGREALECRDDGMAQDEIRCERGCDDASNDCRPETACAVAGVDAVEEGDTLAFDTCPWGDDWTFEAGDPECPGGPANSADRILRLNVAEEGRYRIQVRDVDAGRRVDPVVYLRRACDEEGSQFACDDDVDGTDVTARIDAMLDAGDYFLVVDGLDYPVPSTDYTCGNVELTVTRL
jgi:hypothetical protein